LSRTYAQFDDDLRQQIAFRNTATPTRMAATKSHDDVPSLEIALDNEPRSVLRLPNTQVHTILQDRLFLGPGFAATSQTTLRKDDITHVLNVAVELETQNFSDVRVLHLKLRDSPDQVLPFERATAFIAESLESGGRCLVHCNAGQSRSASLVMHFLVKHGCCSLRDAYYFVKARKPDVGPNYGFYEQLRRAELELRGSNSIDMNKLKADSLLCVLEGSSKTMEDVLKALEEAKGDAELALEQLLCSSS